MQTRVRSTVALLLAATALLTLVPPARATPAALVIAPQLRAALALPEGQPPYLAQLRALPEPLAALPAPLVTQFAPLPFPASPPAQPPRVPAPRAALVPVAPVPALTPQPPAAPAAVPTPMEAPSAPSAVFAPAPARPRVAPAPYWVRDGQTALRSLPLRPDQFGYTIEYAPARPGYFGLTDTGRRVITLYVRPGEDPGLMRHIVAHELGHAYDAAYGSDAFRAQFLAARHVSAPWYPSCDSCSDFSYGAGDFAETFAAYWAGRGYWHSTLSAEPSAAQLRELAPLLGAG